MSNSNLLICPECGKQVSRMAKFCPNCGCPIDYIINNSKKATPDKTGFRDKADAGDPVAQANYASCLANGTNVEKNPELAKKYAEKSARQFNPYGMYVYAVMLVNPDIYGGVYESRLAFLLLLVASKYDKNASKMLAEWFRDGNYPLDDTYEDYYEAILNRHNPVTIDYDLVDNVLEYISNDRDKELDISFNNEYQLLYRINELFDDPLEDEDSSSSDVADEDEEESTVTEEPDEEYLDESSVVEDDSDDYVESDYDEDPVDESDDGIEEIDESYFEEDNEVDNGYRDDSDYSED